MMEVLQTLQDFIDQGGAVLWVIFATSVLLWLLILERAWFVRIVWPSRARMLVAEWDARSDCRSWRAKKIREATVSQVSLELHALLPLIQVLVTICVPKALRMKRSFLLVMS